MGARVKSWVVIASLLVVLGAGILQAEPRYNVVTLPTLGGSQSHAEYISDDGKILGWAHDASGKRRAVMWEDGMATEFPQDAAWSWSIARDMNDNGDICGFVSTGGTTRPCIWHADDTYTVVALSSSFGESVNDAGQVAIVSYVAGGESRARIWTADNGTQLLPAFSGNDAETYYINDLGEAVGWARNASGEQRPCLWDDAGVHELGDLGGSDGNARFVDDMGRIVGHCETDNGETHAFLYTEAGGMQDLGLLGGDYSRARKLNILEQVVGVSEIDNGDLRAFLWENGQMMDLNDLIVENSGWVLEVAPGINGNGFIVGDGTFQGEGQRSFLLTPVPEPATMLLLGTGLMGIIGMKRRRRCD